MSHIYKADMNKLPLVKIKPDAPKTLTNAWASITLILNQFPNIADGWNSINEAVYKIEKFRVLTKIICSNVDKVCDGVQIIEDLRKLWVSTADAHGKEELMFRIRTESAKSHELYIATTAKIESLKGSMSKTKKFLMKQQRHQRANMLGSTIHFLTNLLEYFAVEDAASPLLKIVQGMLAALILANIVLHWIAGKELSKPRKIKVDTLVVQNRLEESKITIDEAKAWIEINDQLQLHAP